MNIDFSVLTWKELNSMYRALGWEMMRRTWWLYTIIFAVVLGCITVEVLQQRRWKRNG